MAGTKSSGGRNRKPVQTHVLLGTFQPHRHQHTTPTPTPPAGRPDARDLTGEARAEWDRMCARLEAVGTLSTVDDAALRRYVTLHAQTEGLEADHRRLARLSGRLTREAHRLKGKNLVAALASVIALEKVRARHLAQARQGAMALRQWLVEFGMTPAARTRVHAPPVGQVATTTDTRKAKYLDALTTRTS